MSRMKKAGDNFAFMAFSITALSGHHKSANVVLNTRGSRVCTEELITADTTCKTRSAMNELRSIEME